MGNHRHNQAAAQVEAYARGHEQWLRLWLRADGLGSDIDDVVQDCFLRMLTSSSIGEVENPRALMKRIARNLIIDRHRHNSLVPFVSIEEASDIASDVSPPDEAFDSRRALERVVSAIAGLPCLRREILERRRFALQPASETAADLGISVSGVEKNLRAGLAVLRRARDLEAADGGMS